MKQISGETRMIPLRLILIIILAVGGAALSAPHAPLPEYQTGIVYYQVTYADGKVRDLNEIPKVKKGIRRVVRISRFEHFIKGCEILTTHRPEVRLIRPGLTVKHELTWNSKAWVGPEQKPPKPPPRTLLSKNVISREIRKTRRIVKALRKRLVEHDHAVAEAERKLAGIKGSDGEQTAKGELEKARRSRKTVLEAIEQYNLQLDALIGVTGDKDFGQPAGRLEQLRRPPGKGNIGIVEPTVQRAVLPHRVQVWKLPRRRGRRNCAVAMAHPEAGRFGAFYYVAYADTDGDGRPDKLIARSPLASADAPGNWTRWSFITSEPVVFVGNAWPEETAGVYCTRTKPRTTNWRGLEAEVFVAPLIGVTPKRKWTWQPYLTNIRINVNQNPEITLPSDNSVSNP